MANVKSKDGTSIAFTKTGKGDALILVDGALCSRALGPMAKIAELLAPHFTVFIYDRRGRNESGNTEPYSVEKEVDDIDALITEAGGSAFIAGLSSGAGLALRTAARGNAGIKKLVLYEAPYVMNMGGHNPPADSEKQLKQLIAAGERGKAVKFFMKDMVGLPGIMIGIMSATPIWSKLKSVAHTLPYDAAVMGDYTLPIKMAASDKVPTLVAGGDKSPLSMQNAMKKLADAIPDSKSIFLKGQNHNVTAKAIAPVLIKYFKTGESL